MLVNTTERQAPEQGRTPARSGINEIAHRPVSPALYSLQHHRASQSRAGALWETPEETTTKSPNSRALYQAHSWPSLPKGRERNRHETPLHLPIPPPQTETPGNVTGSGAAGYIECCLLGVWLSHPRALSHADCTRLSLSASCHGRGGS